MTDISNQVPLSEILASNESRYEGNKTRCNGDCGSNYCDTNGCTERERVYVKPINAITKFAEELLDKYGSASKEYVSIDMLDPFAEWLIIQLYEAQKERREEKMKPYTTCAHIGKNIISPIDKI